ncbi:MAG TPA: 2-C-methyl-D-erythritol 4-phosphate cytidylyltransferase [Terriglobia bacterium]|nr:2-C-methyl-D-erythritol 4-phosphate cytidylyltransferase [Terriglobia bacterium]
MSVLTIIPAAGVGTRMGGETPKQFLSLDGTPIFIYTLRKLASAQVLDEIFLAVRPGEVERVRLALDGERFEKPLRLTEGGGTRQETVARALARASQDTEIVVVHDAVRPFITAEMVEQVVEAARSDGAAILGIPSVDTVKQVEHEVILGTIPRERIALAQTPQAFRYSLFREAVSRAVSDGFQGTDESSLVERLGAKVRVLMGSDRNIKITKPSDLPLARLFIDLERQPEGRKQ